MADGQQLHEGFAAAQVLADRLYNMQRDQIDTILEGLKEIRDEQKKVQSDVAIIKTATTQIPTLETRINSLESTRDKQNALIAGVVFLIGIGETILHFVFRK